MKITIGPLGFLGGLFILLKMMNFIQWSWLWVLSPFLIALGIPLLLVLSVLLMIFLYSLIFLWQKGLLMLQYKLNRE